MNLNENQLQTVERQWDYAIQGKTLDDMIDRLHAMKLSRATSSALSPRLRQKAADFDEKSAYLTCLGGVAWRLPEVEAKFTFSVAESAPENPIELV